MNVVYKGTTNELKGLFRWIRQSAMFGNYDCVQMNSEWPQKLKCFLLPEKKSWLESGCKFERLVQIFRAIAANLDDVTSVVTRKWNP